MSTQNLQLKQQGIGLIERQSRTAAHVAGATASILSSLIWWIALFVFETPPSALFLVTGLLVGGAVMHFGQGLHLYFRVTAIGYTLLSYITSVYFLELGFDDLYIALWMIVGLGLAFTIAEPFLKKDQRTAIWKAEMLSAHVSQKNTETLARTALLALAGSLCVIFSTALIRTSNGFIHRLLEKPRSNLELLVEEGSVIGRSILPDQCLAAIEKKLNCQADAICKKKIPHLLSGCLKASQTNLDDESK